jgi:enterochelin esterase-like enzyme
MTRRAWIVFVSLCKLAFGCALAADSQSPATPHQPESLRLRGLAAALDAHDADALTRFWKDVDAAGTPLIESVPGRPDDVLFTFLWKADPHQVALNVQFNGWFPLHTTQGFDDFTRLQESSVWYTSYTLPRTSQIRYELISPKGWHAAPDRATYFTMEDKEYETFHDPLNPRVAHWNNTVTSYAQGPGAAKTSSYLEKHAEVPAGDMQTLDVESKVLGNRRTLRVYLPTGYRGNTRDYGLLLAYDGNQYTTAVPLPTILDNMIAAHAIAPVIAIFLESPNRDVEFPPNDDFQRFVGAELVPELRRHYRISRDPHRNTVLGSSYGGLAATYTAFVHPEIFGRVISQSGSYGWNPEAANAPLGRGPNPEFGWLIKRIAEAPRKPIRFYLDAGLWEGGGMLSSNRLLQSVLSGKGYEVSYREEPGTHHSYYWMLRLPDALASLH